MFCGIATTLKFAQIYLSTAREVQRLDAVAKTPILNYLTQIIRGNLYVRNCVQNDDLIKTQVDNVNGDIRNQVIVYGLQSWGLLYFLTIQLTADVFMIIVTFYLSDDPQELTYVLMMSIMSTSSVIQFINGYTQLEIYMCNFERCQNMVRYYLQYSIQFYYERNIPLEEFELTYENQNHQKIKKHYKDDQNSINQQIEMKKIDTNIPMIEMQNVSFRQPFLFSLNIFQNNRYREKMSNVLNNISAKMYHKQKIGVVGRTGAGKSSLTLGLTKIIEQTEGNLYLYGQKYEKISLKDLRDQISVIPQDPFVFEGTLQENLDPNSKYSQQAIINAIKKTYLDKCTSFKDGLYSQISILGDNLSQGEKQLISICRAFLDNKQIVLIDEATSYIDHNIEQLIAKNIDEKFQNQLVITIAHKIQTILNSDQIMVLDSGRLIEYDSPNILLQTKDSMFHSIASNLLIQNK